MLFGSKALRQVAALPYVHTDQGVEVALVTTRRRKRWVVPKGWPEKRLTMPEVAATEALEEAGIVGHVASEAIGSFRYQKDTGKGYEVTCEAYVYPLLALEQRLSWKEKGQRRVGWYPCAQAAELVSDPGLSKILNAIAANPKGLGGLEDC